MTKADSTSEDTQNPELLTVRALGTLQCLQLSLGRAFSPTSVSPLSQSHPKSGSASEGTEINKKYEVKQTWIPINGFPGARDLQTNMQ